MRDKLLKGIAAGADKKPVIILLVALVITAIMGVMSEQLRLDMHFKNLMPQNHPMVNEFNRIVEDYTSASMIIVAATGEEKQLKSFAEELAPQIRSMKNVIRPVDVTMDTSFINRHGFMLQKAKNLKNNADIFQDLNLIPFLTHLNDSFEKTYVQDEESISTKEKENNAVAFLDGIQTWLTTLDAYITGNGGLQKAQVATDRFLGGETYMISQDKDMLLMMVQPNFTINDLDKVLVTVDSIDALIAEVVKNYSGLEAGTTGTMALSRDETVAASEDMYITSIIAMLLIIALFIVSFRMWVAPVLAGITLIVGVTWTAGFAAVTLGSLNIMTSMFAVILIGLGVDFSIHVISIFTESRAAGQATGKALESALLKSGQGIITGAFTTAAAFYTLTISETAGMAEFGLLAGSGVLFCMLATLVVLPAMLSLRDRMLLRMHREAGTARTTEFGFLGKTAGIIAGKRTSFLIGLVIATALMFWFARQITFDYNYLNMEPEGLKSIKLQHLMEDEFEATPDFAMITAQSIEESRRIAEKAKDMKMVGMVTSISEYIPSKKEQRKRAPYIEKIRMYLKNQPLLRGVRPAQLEKFLEQVCRLQDNIIELAQLAYLGGQDKVDAKCKMLAGDPENPEDSGLFGKLYKDVKTDTRLALQGVNRFQQDIAPLMQHKALRMANADEITLAELPATIADQFLSKKGDKFLITIYPKESVWNFEFLERFTDRMQNLDPRVTGMPLVFYVLIQKIAVDGRNAAMLTLVVVFLLLLWDFRRVSFVLMAMVPLIVGAFWMVGAMYLSGLQLTMVNLMGLPLILGIGIDDGVHLLHRFRYEGGGNISSVFKSTGKAVLLTSLTTMLAFGSLVFATYRGLGSLGIALFIGVAACFLTSVLFLPALLTFVKTDKGNK